MKKILFILLLIGGCCTSKEFVEVPSKRFVPNGSRYIEVQSSFKTVVNVFKKNNIGVLSYGENGGVTEEILLDGETRARYEMYVLNDSTIKITAWWGYTNKTKEKMVFFVGPSLTSALSSDLLKPVIYDRDSKRPKKVFDYMCSLFDKERIYYEYR